MAQLSSVHDGGFLEAWSEMLSEDPGRCSILTGYDEIACRNVVILGLVENFPWSILLQANTDGMLSVSCVVV